MVGRIISIRTEVIVGGDREILKWNFNSYAVCVVFCSFIALCQCYSIVIAILGANSSPLGGSVTLVKYDQIVVTLFRKCPVSSPNKHVMVSKGIGYFPIITDLCFPLWAEFKIVRPCFQQTKAMPSGGISVAVWPLHLGSSKLFEKGDL